MDESSAKLQSESGVAHLRTCIIKCIGGLLLAAAGASCLASAHGIILGAVTGVIGSPAKQDSRLDVVKRIGFDAVRVDAAWKYVETTKGSYRIPHAWDQFVDRAAKRGIKVDLILDYGNKLYDGGGKPHSPGGIAAFVRYATFVVRHFLGRVRYYEIWNEWDTHIGGAPPGDAKDYARLFNAVYPAIKRIDPTATFMVTSSSSDRGYEKFYEKLAALGVLSRCDAVAFHPYDLEEPNYRDVIGARGPEVSIQRVIGLEAMMRRRTGRTDVPIYITEIGWPTNIGRFGFSKKDVSAMAERMLLMASGLQYVKGLWWYDLRDSCADRRNKQCRFGLTREDLSYKPAAHTVDSLAALIENNTLEMDPRTNLATGLVVLDERLRGSRSRIAWYVGTVRKGSGETPMQYGISCDPALQVVRTMWSDHIRPTALTSTPTEFFYTPDGCRQRMIGGQK